MPRDAGAKTVSGPRAVKPRLAYAVLVFAIIIGLGLGFISLSKKPNTCNQTYHEDGIVYYGRHDWLVQIARSDQAREVGLSGKSCLPDSQAMLFQFDKPGYYPFWMKDMKFPIDIIWISSAGEVTDIDSNVAPSSYPKTFTNTQPADKVLEIKAGQADQLGIKTGSHINS